MKRILFLALSILVILSMAVCSSFAEGLPTSAPQTTSSPAVIPNPACLSQLAGAGDAQVAAGHDGYINLLWTVTLTDGDRAALGKAYQALCEEAGFASVGAQTDESGYVLWTYQAGDMSFALYISCLSVQLVLPETATLSDIAVQPAPTATPFSLSGLIKPDPTPAPTVAPSTNRYLRGMFNGKWTEFYLLSGHSGNDGSILSFRDETGTTGIKYLSIDYSKAFKLYQTYRIDRKTLPPGFEIGVKLSNEKWIIHQTDTNLLGSIPSGDYIELTLTTLEQTRMAGTLSFSLGGGRYVLENGEFLGFGE